ncbi:unnamed protein product, partial [Didymodactylos carnosus]
TIDNEPVTSPYVTGRLLDSDTANFNVTLKVWANERTKTIVNPHRPAMAVNYIQQTDEEGSILDVLTDYVEAVRYPYWPIIANEWSTRQRQSNWPSDELIQRIVSDGCSLVPEFHLLSTCYRDIEWRFSFSSSEKLLSHSLSNTQRKCYVLVKTLLFYKFKLAKIENIKLLTKQ